ncbi:MAG: MFS transporter, partial [Treponema sp.]|nr:MFS transporter [Treponema sp.]
GILYKKGGYPLPFFMTSIMMILALAVLALFVREPKQAYEPEAENKITKIKLSKVEMKSLILILAGIFFWFTGYNAVETFFTLYAKNTLGMDPGSATMTLAIFSLTFLAFAVPAGFIGAKIGRRRAILIGLAGLIVLFLPMFFLANVWLVRVCLFFGGFFWAFVNINSLPMVVRLSGEEKIGTYIGYYYFFSFSSQIISPILFGFIRDVTKNYRVLFLYSCIAFVLAIISLFFVRHGEDTPNRENEPEKVSATEILSGLDD